MNPNMKLMLSLFLALAAMESSAEPCHAACPPFWVPFRESCYRAFGTKLNWQAAENACRTHFNEFEIAHLVSFGNEAERLFVHELWKSATGNMVALGQASTFWIGLNDADSEGTWVWTDTNEAATYTRWLTGQPSNSGGSEDCAHETTNDPNSPTWNDRPCGNEIYYVCEMPQSK